MRRFAARDLTSLPPLRRLAGAMLLCAVSSVPAQPPAPGPELVVQTGVPASVGVVDMAFTPDGRWLAAANGKAITLWETASGRVSRRLLGHLEEVTGIQFTPDGRSLVSSGEDKTVRIWNVARGREVRMLRGHGEPVTGIALSANGRLLVSGSGAGFGRTIVELAIGAPRKKKPVGTVRLWDYASGREVARLEEPAKTVALSPDGAWLAIGGDDLAVWRVSEALKGAPPLQRLRGCPDGTSLEFSPDSRFLATGCQSGSIRLVEVGRWNEARVLSGAGRLNRLRFSSDGRWLAAGDLLQTRLWELSSGKKILERDGIGIAFTPDSGALALHNDLEGLRLLEVPSGRPLRTLGGGTDYLDPLALSSNARWMATIGGAGIRLWDIQQGRVVNQFPWTLNPVALTPDGRRIVIGGDETAVFDAASGKPLMALQRGTSSTAAAFSPDGRLLALGTKPVPAAGREFDCFVNIHEASTGRQVRSLPGHCTKWALAFSPDGRRLASAGSGGSNVEVRIWDVGTGRQLHRLGRDESLLPSIAFSPDGSRLAAAAWSTLESGSGVKLWDVETGRELAMLTDHSADVEAVAFSPDGRWLASGAKDGVVVIREAAGGRPLHTLMGHEGIVRNLLWTPDGRTLISGGMDAAVRLWDPATGKPLALLVSRRTGDDWLAATPEGMFSGSPQGMEDLVAWRIGERTYPPDRFFTDYYAPGLLGRLFRGERPQPVRSVVALKLPPEVRIVEPAAGSASAGQRISVRVEAREQGGGLNEVRLYQNGKLIGAHPRGAGPMYLFPIDLVAGVNVLKAVALSADRVESLDHSVRTVWTPPAAPAKPVLHVLVVGIDDYEDPRFRLRFARADAEAISRFFAQRSSRLFRSIDRVELFDRQATKSNIRKALGQIVSKAEPQDVVLIYLAGHGVGVGQQYYFLAQEMRNEPDEDAAVRKYGLPASDLGDTLQMKALKQILILDACQSGAALTQLAKAMTARGIRPSEEMDKAVNMLARSHGINLIAAATERQNALEVTDLQHGILTYALLSGLGEKGRPAAATGADGFVTVVGLIDYISRQVPELTEKYHPGAKQYPVHQSNGINFPVWAP